MKHANLLFKLKLTRARDGEEKNERNSRIEMHYNLKN